MLHLSKGNIRTKRSACACNCKRPSRWVKAATESFLHHDNEERPNQARSCGNQPPGVACPTFPTLAAVPETIDPDRWLDRIRGQVFTLHPCSRMAV